CNKPSVRIDCQFAILANPIFASSLRTVAINLRTIPPVGFSIGEGGRSGMIIRPSRRIGSRATHQHLASWPGIARGDRYIKGIIVDWARRAVIKPVMGLKLNPSGRQQIEDRCRLKIIGAVGLLLSPQ